MHSMEGTSLLKLTTALDRTAPEQTLRKLDALWSALTRPDQDGTHAVEKVILRWLLKAIHGASPEAETLRRYPLTWAILGCVFSRIPLSSLAKALADRRFVNIVQQTAKDVSSPTRADADANLQPDGSEKSGRSSVKRKRSLGTASELEALRDVSGCLQTAESLFVALGRLLSRIAPEAGYGSSERAGAEHVKALFRVSAAEALGILSPLLAICQLAMDSQGVEALDNQESWVNIAAGMWDLRLQKNSDALEFALHLSKPCVLMLAKLLGAGVADSHALGTELAVAWTRDLKRLVTRNFVLPARSEFFGQKSTDILATPVMLKALPAAVLSPTLLLLVLEAPQAIGGASAKRDCRDWFEAAFDLLEAPLRSLAHAERNAAVRRLLALSVAHRNTPASSSLLSVCQHYAVSGEFIHWPLVSLLVECNADVFLSGEGRRLWSDIIKRAPHEPVHDQCDYNALCSMMRSFAKASARARELPRCIRQWFDGLVECFTAVLENNTSTHRIFWLDPTVSSVVTSLLQQSLTTKQLCYLIEDLGQFKNPSAQAARAVVFDAICQGITAEDFMEAAGATLFEQVWSTPIPFDLAEASAAQWRIAAKAFAIGLCNPADGPGLRVVESLRRVLGDKATSTSHLTTFDAYRCAAAAWLASYAAVGLSAGVGQIMSGFLKRLSLELDREGLSCRDGLLQLWCDPAQAMESVDPFQPLPLGHLSATAYTVWTFLAFPRLVPLLSVCSTNDFTAFLSIVWQSISKAAMTRHEDATQVSLQALSTVMVSALATVPPDTLSSVIVCPIIEAISITDKQTWALVDILAKVPIECFTREDRERVISHLSSQLLVHSLSASDNAFAESCMGVMVQMTRKKPIFCPQLSFQGLLELGTSISHCMSDSWPSNLGIAGAAVTFQLFEELARLTVSQMTTSPGTREMKYIRDIWPAVSEHISGQHDSHNRFATLTLLLIFVSVMQQPTASKHFTQEVTQLDKALEELGRLATVGIIQFFGRSVGRKDSAIEVKSYMELRTALLASKVHWTPELNAAVASLKEKMVSELPIICPVDSELGALFRGFLQERMGLPQGVSPESLSTGSRHEPLKTAAEESGVNLAALAEDDEVTTANLLRSVSVGLRPSTSNRSAQLLTARQILRGITATSSPEASANLSMAQSALTEILVRPSALTEFVDAARIIHSLLDGSLASTKQWNVEHTLSSIAVLCSDNGPRTGVIRSSGQSYEWLCRLTEAILKRHRRRLEGHLHLLVTTLNSLLSCLIRHPYDARLQRWAAKPSTGGVGSHPYWETHAKMYSRLLTLVCEPSVASVVRLHQSVLNSATDAPKRSAGRHMYLVVMNFIKLQLEESVPHGVREALLLGVYSVLDVTPPDMRKLMVDAMDPSGRAIWKDLYEKYRKFGKWAGA